MAAEGDEDYVGQLRGVFDECDRMGQGLLGKAELINLCEKLQVEDQAEALVERLVGSSNHKRVSFEEFKEGFVAVLSTCVDLISTEEEFSANSYYDEAASPKFVRDGKKYGRRSKPEQHGSETPLDFAELSDMEADFSYTSPAPTPKSGGKSRRLHTTPVSQTNAHRLTPEDEPRNTVLSPLERSNADIFEGEGLVNKSMGTPGPDKSEDISEVDLLREIWKKQGVGRGGYLTFDELAVVCDNIGMEKMSEEELENLFDKLDADGDGRVSFDEFVKGLSQHGGQTRPLSSQGRKPRLTTSLILDNDRRTQTPSILSAILGSGYFSYLDPETTGYAQPEDIIELWESFGVAHDDIISVLEALEFDLGSRINLQELSSVLEQELLNHEVDNAVYQVAIYSCRQELRYIKGIVETSNSEKAKLREDIESAKRSHEILIRESDERHATLEKQLESRAASNAQKYQEQMRALQSQLDREREIIAGNAQIEKQGLETTVSKLKEEEMRLKQELTFNQRDLTNIEKELQAHIDRNSILEKENERVKREMETLAEFNKQLEGIVNHKSQLTKEQTRTNEQKIKELEEENKELRDKADELTLEVEEVRQQLAAGQARQHSSISHSRRGSLLSDYPVLKHESEGDRSPDLSGDENEGRKRRKLPPSHEEEMLKFEIIKLKDQHMEEMKKLRKAHNTEKVDIHEGYKTEVKDMENKYRKKITELESQLDEEKLNLRNSDSDWRRKHETEKAQLKLAASHERVELMNKLQDEHREQLVQMRQELGSQYELEIRSIREQLIQEKDSLDIRYKKRIQEFEHMFERGSDSLRGKLREDFFQLVEEQTQNEIEVEKRHLDALWQKERDELYDLLNKEKQSMEDQFNDRLYQLEQQMDDAEEDVRAQCEEEFLEQIQVVQEAFNEERVDYENQIAQLKKDALDIHRKMEKYVNPSELERANKARDDALSDRDGLQLERNKMMIERNTLQTQLEQLKRVHEREKAVFQTRMDDLHSLVHADPNKSTTAVIHVESSLLVEERNSLLEEVKTLQAKISESQETVFKLTADLHLEKSQRSREVQDLRGKAENLASQELLRSLEHQVELSRQRNKELEEAIKINASESHKLLLDTQDEHRKLVARLSFEKDEYKRQLSTTRLSLSEVTDKLKQQLVKTTKSDQLVKDLYIENANLVEALYVTEKRQKVAEWSSMKAQAHSQAVSQAFRKAVPAIKDAIGTRG